jgi:iron complex transport system permease protein
MTRARTISARLAQVDPAAELAFTRRVPLWVKISIPLALVVVFVVSFAIGTYPVSPPELISGLYDHFFNASLIDADHSSTLYKIDKVIFSNRLPRIAACLLIGGALAAAGASYQGMFKNPLVSPDLLGAAAGASLGASIAMLLNLDGLLIQACAFAGGIIAVSLTVSLTRLVKYDPLLGLVLGGVLVSTLFQSGSSMVKLLADANDKLPEITYWLMGSFSKVTVSDFFIALPFLLIGIVLLLTQSWKLNVLSFGEEEARSLGVDTRRTRLIVIIGATLLTSASVAVAGIIGWIGLVIPHLARSIVGPNYRVLLPVSLLIGAAYLLVIDDICRVCFSPEMPIGIMTAIIGIPFFLFIFRRNVKA